MKIKLNTKYIEQYRNRRGFTQSELSTKIGYKHSSAYNNIMKHGHIPRIKYIEKLVTVLRCNFYDIFIVKK
jgi:DNA-binding XRE family transcriptional regulator